jgi:Zn-dependent protease with chaperone function
MPPVLQGAPPAVPVQQFNVQPPPQPLPPVQLQYQNNYPQQAPPPVYVQAPPRRCLTCGGEGLGLSNEKIFCAECRWLRPLLPGYQVDNSAFGWAADAKAMSVLRSITPLNAAARAVSEKVGRRWVETMFNGVLLSEKQLPKIFGQAVRSARILGMSHMPDVYLSGDRPWDCLTFGSDKDSFIVIGSALAGNFQGVDMLFLLAREMGHCKAGHALWKTVIRFLLGEQGNSKGVLAGGVFSAILNPTALIGGAIEVPLLAWARQAEITADRAGLLAVGNENIARRVLLSWSLRSSVMFKQINIEAWLEQQTAEIDGYTKLSELTMSSTPYLGPRLKLLTQFANSPEFNQYKSAIAETLKRAAPLPRPAEPKPPMPQQNPAPPTGKSGDVIRLKCAGCRTAIKIPAKLFAGRNELPVKCPNAKCGTVMRLKKNVKPAADVSKTDKRRKFEEDMNNAE